MYSYGVPVADERSINSVIERIHTKAELLVGLFEASKRAVVPEVGVIYFGCFKSVRCECQPV